MSGADPVGTFVDEGQAFIERHHAELPDDAAALGGVAFGMMRALAECSNCPGVFRIPLDKQWSILVCPACGGSWQYDWDAAIKARAQTPKGRRRLR